jgi:hypothetical protein
VPQEACDDDTPFRFEDAEPEPRIAYLVRLSDYPHPAAGAVKVAEQRFRRELDRQLGSDVVPALCAFQNASESGENDRSKDEIALAKRWMTATFKARSIAHEESSCAHHIIGLASAAICITSSRSRQLITAIFLVTPLSWRSLTSCPYGPDFEFMMNFTYQRQQARRKLFRNLLDWLGCGKAEIHHVDRVVHHQGNCQSYHFRLP